MQVFGLVVAALALLITIYAALHFWYLKGGPNPTFTVAPATVTVGKPTDFTYKWQGNAAGGPLARATTFDVIDPAKVRIMFYSDPTAANGGVQTGGGDHVTAKTDTFGEIVITILTDRPGTMALTANDDVTGAGVSASFESKY